MSSVEVAGSNDEVIKLLAEDDAEMVAAFFSASPDGLEKVDT